MTIVDVGSGAPIVLVPGIQGRWEWMRPAVDALAAHARVITFSLADEPSAGASFDAARGLDNYVDQVAAALDACGLTRAAICGVSFGGLIAAAFVRRHPERVSSLVLASALPPTWSPDARALRYLAAPRLLAPLFCLSAMRLLPEFAAARGGVGPGLRTAVAHATRAATHPFGPSRMARRVAMVHGRDWSGLDRVRVPTLVVTGDDRLDKVVPPARTREYLYMWPHAEPVTLSGTGHLGFVTRPDDFARIVGSFVTRHAAAERHVDTETVRRRVG